ncbi:MAG: ATPase-like protein, partial [Actinomycetia bacterium]|nr:ATPase-like protein [Actinomycetes bacterium]
DRLVVGAIATAIGLRDASGSTVDSLKVDLADRSLLLVVDNFEHVMGSSELLPELLSASPGLKVLATSREALRLQAEYEFPVPPLVIADSVEMFAERAVAVRPDFRLTDENRDVFERICRRLEGVPLAIELAAARTKLLSPEALLRRLDRRLDFLVSGPRDLPERQRALSTTIEWSYDLLDEWDRRLFRRLGVFVGSFSLGAVEAIAPDGAEEHRDALDVLASLVDKSLLRVEATAGEPRFRMLGMIAEFARSRLAETDDLEAVGALHAVFYRDVSLAIGGGVLRGDQRQWLEVLGSDEEGEAGNVRAALDWLITHERLDDLAAMAWALWVPAWINGRIDEGRRVARAALESHGPMSDHSRTRLLVVLGLFHMWSGDHVEAAEALHEGLDRARALGDDEAEAAGTLAESMMAGPVDGESQSEALAELARELYARRGDTWGEAAALNVLGWLYVAQERFDATNAVLERTLSTSLAVGDEQFSAMAEVNLAEALMHRGDLDGATKLLASCADRHRSARLMYSVAYLLDAAARLSDRTGDPTRAARLVGAASHLRSAAGLSVWGSQLERRDRFVDGLRSTLGAAAFDDAVADGTRQSYVEALADTRLDL